MRQQYKLANRLWSQGKCLARDAVHICDGRIYLLDVIYPKMWYGDTNAFGRVRIANVTRWFNLQSREKVFDNYSTIVRVTSTYRHVEYTVDGGGCDGHGSRGYIALRDSQANEFRWFLFLSQSDPFDKIEFDDCEIVATSTGGLVLRVPFLEPWNLRFVP